MYRHIFFLTTALLLSRPVYADEIDDAYAACTSYRDVAVNVTPRFDEPVYDYSASIAEISRLSADIHHSIHEKMTLGLTRYQPVLEVGAPLVSLQMPDGTSCTYVDHIDVTVGYKDVTVFIASEIPQDSCGFDEVMAHEQKHIHVNLQILQEYLPRIADDLSAYLKENGIFREENSDYAMSLLHDKLQNIINTIIEEMSADNSLRQQGVDTPAEYRRVSASCNGQLRAIVQQARMDRH